MCSFVAILSCSDRASNILRLTAPGVVELIGSAKPGVFAENSGEWSEIEWSIGQDRGKPVVLIKGWTKGEAGWLLRGMVFRAPGLGVGDCLVDVVFLPDRGGAKVRSSGRLTGSVAMWTPIETGGRLGKWEISVPCPPGWQGIPKMKAKVLWINEGPSHVGSFIGNGEKRPGIFLTEGSTAVCSLEGGRTRDLEFGVSLASPWESPGRIIVAVIRDGEIDVVGRLRVRQDSWRDTSITIMAGTDHEQLHFRCEEGMVLIGSPILRERGGEDLRPNVLLISLDTVRGDHLDPFVPEGLPDGLKSFAARSVIFERAVAQATVTDASHHSIMTGLCVPRHGAGGQLKLSKEIPTLAGMLAENDYRTAASTIFCLTLSGC